MNHVLIIALLSVFLLLSCGEDNNGGIIEKTCKPVCNEWETCNTELVKCEVNQGFCNENQDCMKNSDEKTVCDNKHQCIKPFSKPSVGDVETYCVTFFSCGFEEYAGDIGYCTEFKTNIINLDLNSVEGSKYYFLQKRYTKAVNCSKLSNNCEEFAECLDIEVTDIDCTAAGKKNIENKSGNFEQSCENNKRVFCGNNNKVIKIDCGSETVCKVDMSGYEPRAFCGIPEVECNKNTFIESCEDNSTLKCYYDGGLVTRKCPQGTKCYIHDKDGKIVADCKVEDDTLPDCDYRNYKVKCEDKFKTVCMYGKEMKLDCTVDFGENFTCKENSNGADEYFFNNCTYNEIKNQNTGDKKQYCDGNILKYYVNNTEHSYNCVENGYDKCTKDKENAICDFN